MQIDRFGQQIYTENDLVNLYLTNTEHNLRNVLINKSIRFSDELDLDNAVPRKELANVKMFYEVASVPQGELAISIDA